MYCGWRKACNVWGRRSAVFDDMLLAGSAFVGVDPPVGQLYCGYGLTKGGRNSLYLLIGRAF